MSELRNCFDRTLKTKGLCPENSLYYVALGTALGADETYKLDSLIYKLKNTIPSGNYNSLPPLFKNKNN